MYFVIPNPIDGKNWVFKAANMEAAKRAAHAKFQALGAGGTDLQSILTADWTAYPEESIKDHIAGNPDLYVDVGGTGATGGTGGTGTTGGTGGTGATGGTGTGNEYIGEETALGRRAGFQRALAARGRPTGGFAGEYYQDQFDPYESAFQGELATNIGGIGSQHDPQVGNQQLFSKYIGQNDNPYGAILNQFRTLQGLGAGGSNEFANRLTTPDESSLADSQGFFQNALRARLGGYAASLLSPSLGRASVGYAGQPVATNGAPNQQQNYLEFMRQRLGLGGVNF